MSFVEILTLLGILSMGLAVLALVMAVIRLSQRMDRLEREWRR